MKLYYSPGACSLAPHIALREVDAEFELVRIKVREGENFRPEFLAVNPRARVPALELDGKIYTETPALLVYIASLNPGAGLLPQSGSPDLARCLEWLGWLSSSLHIAYAQHWRPERFLPEGSDSAALTEFGKQTIERMNAEVEERLAGPWLLGRRFSLADIYALPFFRWAFRVGLPMREDCPKWTAWTERMLERPAVLAAIEHEGIAESQFRRPG